MLSNLILDELDKELERRGLRYCRYADDSNIYVKSERAGQRVMASLSQFISRKLKLRVNQEKSAVGRPSERKFLGFTFTADDEPKRKIAPQALPARTGAGLGIGLFRCRLAAGLADIGCRARHL